MFEWVLAQTVEVTPYVCGDRRCMTVRQFMLKLSHRFMCDTPTNKREESTADEGSVASRMAGFDWRVSSGLSSQTLLCKRPRSIGGGRRPVGPTSHKAFKSTMLPPAASDLTYDIVSAI